MKCKTLIQYCLPHHLLSRLIGKLATSKIPWLKNLFISWFIKRYQIDMSTAIETNPYNYPSFNSFFTRALKPEARPILGDNNTIISPVDGHISQLGKLNNNLLLQAKNHYYDLQALLGTNLEKYHAIFTNGDFINIYLSPKDYHRVHMPITGKLIAMAHIPGKLFSVNSLTSQEIPNLFAKNERVIAIFATEIGPIAIILIGAMLVASINTIWTENIIPASITNYENSDINLERGAEMGRFQFGSTVILLFPQNALKLESHLTPGNKILMGQNMGSITK